MKKPRSSNGALMGKLVQSIMDFLLRSGLDQSDVEVLFKGCLAELSRQSACGKSQADSKYVGNGNVSAEVIRVWHRDGRFLDGDARPKPLQLSRGPRSLGALVKDLDPSVDHKQSIRAMRAVGLIRRLPDGRYVPTAESVTIDYLHPLAIEHVAKSVVRLVSTVCRNTDPHRNDMSLIERYAYVPDLNKAQSVAFAEFTRAQGMAYLEAVDDWLERRRVRRLPSGSNSAADGIPAGVHLFAYLGEAHRSKTTKRAATRSKATASRIDVRAAEARRRFTAQRAIRA